MNHTLKVIALASLLISNACYSQDFDKGVKACEPGNYATAMREWRPLAEQGVVKAQYRLGLMYAKGQGVAQDRVRHRPSPQIANNEGARHRTVYSMTAVA